MALGRNSGNRFASTIWPGYVDAMTALLMVLIFLLTVFIVVQSLLRERITVQDSTISTQEQEIDERDTQLARLGARVSELGAALSVSQDQARSRSAEVARLSDDLAASRSRLTDFEAEVATLMAAREQDRSDRQQLQGQLDETASRASAAELAVAAARSEIDAQAEQARLAAARHDALMALVADLRQRGEQAQDEMQARLSQAEADRLTEAAAAQALRDRLQGADAELTAMTLALEESRKQAEETLTLLAAARAAQDQLTDDARAAAERATQAEARAALLATAQDQLAQEQAQSAEGQRRLALLNEQVSALNADLGRLQAALDASGDEQRAAELRVQDLGTQLNAALLLAAEEKDRRLALETEARTRAETEARDLARYRSEFFGRLSQILEGRQGVRIVGDRFVFDSSVLFQTGEANLSPEGQAQIRNVAQMLTSISQDIPPEIDWIIRVDGHTDNLPLSGMGRYRDNWELSQARALAVVRYMTGSLGFPADRLAPTGFADTRPVTPEDSAEGRALNRRIELKLTER
ncbi:MAG: peptidoglycan -binding protein [Paracoccus sp. (in: a-proteobacteria)]|uniref:peptidoglycan -binding protein n=1 Tax=Paracoccus sp. TaxID=267 RepID=UPI0026E09AB6|nr:peptidoglycan -binding protein [Paracoccus sp. (in: a-proteobacteria)]MDO5613447.1 peptidoglycan -binding protein [Paracoccus sp. (in: a-proteobacteria)]